MNYCLISLPSRNQQETPGITQRAFRLTFNPTVESRIQYKMAPQATNHKLTRQHQHAVCYFLCKSSCPKNDYTNCELSRSSSDSETSADSEAQRGRYCFKREIEDKNSGGYDFRECKYSLNLRNGFQVCQRKSQGYKTCEQKSAGFSMA